MNAFRPFALAWIVLVLAGCFALQGAVEPPPDPAWSSGSAPASRPAPKPITVFAAASLAEVFADLGLAFERAQPGYELIFNFAGSNTLALQIASGARADLIASADARSLERLRAQGLIEPPIDFARNRLVLAVPAGNPGRIRGFDDLLPAGTPLVLAGPEVPAGRYGREYLRLNGAAAVLDRPISDESDVRAVVGKLLLGEADAGIVYASDIVALGEGLLRIPIEGEQVVEARYPMARLSAAREPEGARALSDFILSAEGRRLLEARGFRLP